MLWKWMTDIHQWHNPKKLRGTSGEPEPALIACETKINPGRDHLFERSP